MKRLKNANRYLRGAMFGMLGEYIYRVDCSVTPVVLLVLLGVIILIEIFENP